MSKIKGSSSAVKMKYLLIVFATAVLVALPTRVYQLLALVDTANGFYKESDVTIPVLYGIVAVFTVLFLVLSFLSKEVPSPKLPTGKNPVLGVTSLVMVAGFSVDMVSIIKNTIPVNQGNSQIFISLLRSNLAEQGGALTVLRFVFAFFAIVYFLVFAMSHLNGKASYKEFKLLALSPLCWSITMLVLRLMHAISFTKVSELLFEIFMFMFMMLFFITFARISSGVYTEDSMWGIYGYGLSACLFAGLVTIPRLVAAFSGLEPVEGHDFSLAHLAILVFIFSYIVASLGVGFKDGISNRKTVTEIDLPDEDIIISKGSVGAFIAEVDEISEDEDNAEEFFAEEPAYADEDLREAVSDKRAEKTRNFFEGLDEASVEESAEEIVAEEITEEPVAEVIEEAPVIEEIAEEPVQVIEEDEMPKKFFGKRKEESEPEVIKPISLADMRKNKDK